MLFLGIMSRQKQNLLWLMIACCASSQITCLKIMIIGDNLTYLNSSTCAAVNTTCRQAVETLIGNFCIMNVKPNTSSQGQCKTSNKMYFFNITDNWEKYEVRMNETVKDIKMWFLKNESEYLPSSFLNSTDHFVTCQTNNTPTTDPITNSCKANNLSPLGCLKILSVDPEKRCTNATYDNDICSGKKGSKYVLHFNGNEWMCANCVNESSTTVRPPSFTTTDNQTTSVTTDETIPTPTLPPPEITYNLTANITTSKSETIEPSKASETMEKMDSLVEEMEKSNKSNAAIVMGDIIGVLQRQAKNTESKDIQICYSSNQNMMNAVERNLNADFPWSVIVPSEAFDKSRHENNGSAFVGVLRFTNMGNKNETVLNNEVYGITMGANISNLTNNIELLFKKKDLVGEASCSSWDGKGNLTWTTSGCETVKIDSNTIKCSCSHLTFFAVLMSPPDVNSNITAPYVESLSFITSIGCGISMFFLSVALFMHFLLRKAKSNQATKILMNMFVALFLLNLSFLSNESVANTEVKAACVFIALLMHYSMLTTFTWFFIQALHMYLWLIRQNITITNYMRKITVFGWTFPAPIVIAVVSVGGYKTLIINTTSGKTTQMCWITDPLIHYIVNIGYYTFVFIFTAGIFIMIVTKIFQARHIKAPDGKRKTFRKQLMMVLSLFLLFGLTWAVAFFSYGVMRIPSYYIFTVLNSFQGFFLFLYYYHIHNDIEGRFSDDPERSSSTTTIIQSRINAVENLYN
ncbi:adhesion G-protein coupled receptor G6-like isoform X19 [Ctenopharyngodon idella]|uniref:adhesion G-protein coupled receptor G6-like isoform X19 n=1 Tax=Ctenopharyngodon idella TaxID=7959 RepID=UPI0022328251|nr:adhesion G-protein coupled receptor G6-like isoform X19 [Ctenopharyngodon idella]